MLTDEQITERVAKNIDKWVEVFGPETSGKMRVITPEFGLQMLRDAVTKVVLAHGHAEDDVPAIVDRLVALFRKAAAERGWIIPE
jgi:hypothetical protein